ncbi:hypothetical protein D9Q98_004463 [Chlorella vulgaris]|uniref:Disease resistance R13L4/SHOC-2-like LRR domain-containing protein n=1 Tax=Chlorella vulgaris TaxID=3077 RepID=A0A9D4TPW9_CHLVU|nr:hypothetical protein D9Q98_004463 [Chlorella vulgaris]
MIRQCRVSLVEILQGAAGELALAVLAAPGPPQLAILGHLEEHDKMSLGSTCTSLRRASLSWFPEVTVEVVPGLTDVESLAAWLERHQACLHISEMLDISNKKIDRVASEAEWSDGLTALPSSLVTSLAVRSSWGLPTAVSHLTALTRLEFDADEYIDLESVADGDLPFSIHAHPLRPLTRLRQLRLQCGDECHIGKTAEELLSLPALAGLQALWLNGCSLQAMPRALSALTRLTSLSLAGDDITVTAPLATLRRLQCLDLAVCKLKAVPEQVSALTALTSLDLFANKLASGWQHLLPLKQLQDLNLHGCSLRAVSHPLSALTGLTRLSLSQHKLAIGWQHLQPLVQLQDLSLLTCSLTAVPRQVSALTGLSRLDLFCNRELTGGWQHLLPLNQLRHLLLPDVSMPGGTAPPELAALTHLRLHRCP